MTAEQFINNYNTAADKNKFLSDCITTKYVKYTEKVADCRKIVNITFEIMGDKKFCVDSPAQFVIFVMNLIYRYTDIDRSEMVVTDFESLDEINLVNARSEWKCKYRGKILYQKGLNKNYYINPDYQG